jgi:hypothetical protein
MHTHDRYTIHILYSLQGKIRLVGGNVDSSLFLLCWRLLLLLFLLLVGIRGSGCIISSTDESSRSPNVLGIDRSCYQDGSPGGSNDVSALREGLLWKEHHGWWRWRELLLLLLRRVVAVLFLPIVIEMLLLLLQCNVMLLLVMICLLLLLLEL